MLIVAFGPVYYEQKKKKEMFTYGTSHKQMAEQTLMTMRILGIGSPTGIEENIEAVTKVAMENRRITIEEIAKDVRRSVGARYCASLHDVSCSQLFGQRQHRNHLSTSAFADLGYLQPFPVPEILPR